MRQNSNFASNYEVPPRFRKSEENIATDSASANTNFTVSVPVGRGKSKSKSPELSHGNHLLLLIKCTGRKEMLYLTMHSTHFIYGYMASDIW